jgi:hypothetical protein
MRDLTCSSYIPLIVDTRNITGRHPPGNACTSSSQAPLTKLEGLLDTSERVIATVRPTARARQIGNLAAFASHIAGRL